MQSGGTLALTASNNYTGGTNIVGGSTLLVGTGNAGASLAGGSTITDNGTLAFDNIGRLAQGTGFGAAAITGSGSLLVYAGSVSLNVIDALRRRHNGQRRHPADQSQRLERRHGA